MATRTKAQRASRMAANNARIAAAQSKAGVSTARQATADASALASMNKVRASQGLPAQAAIGEKAAGRTDGALSINQDTNEVLDASGNVVAKGSSLSDALAKQTQVSSGAAPTVAGRPDLFAVNPGANQEVKPFFDESTQTLVSPTVATSEQMSQQAAGTLDSFNKAQGLTYLDGPTFKSLQSLLNEQDLIRGPEGQIWLRQGLTPEQVLARAQTSVNGTNTGASGLTSADSFTVDVPGAITTDTINELMENPVTESEFNDMLEEIQLAQDELLELMVPSDAEQALKAEVIDIKAQIEKTLTELSMGLNNIEDQPIAMQFITGQQASIERSANAKLQNLARLEENLLYNLGLEQEARAVQASVAQTQLGYLQTNLDTAMKVQQLIQQQEDSIFNRTRALKQDAQSALMTVLEGLQGVDETDMTTDQQKQLQDMAIAAGIPYSLLTEGLTNVKNELLRSRSSLEGLTPDQWKTVNTIQDNARQDPNIKNFADVRASYETARSAATKDDGTGDIVLMRMIAKITDPTTGVREEEFQTFAGAQGTLATFGIKLTEQMWSGGRLTEGGRASLMQQATDIYSQRKSAYDNSVQFYDNQATMQGIPSGMITPYYVAPEAVEGGLPDMSGYSVDQRISDALLNKVKTDFAGNALTDGEIDFLSRYATKLYREGKSDADVIENINMILRGETPPDLSSDLSMSQNGSPLEVAKAYLGASASDPEQAQTLAAFFKKAGGVSIDPATTAWCAAFMNSVLGASGIEGTGSLLAQSFLDFGTPVSTPTKGDIVVFERGPVGGWQGHVGIIDSVNEDGSLQVLGGNQDGSVNVQRFGTSRVLGYRRINQSTTRNISIDTLLSLGTLS